MALLLGAALAAGFAAGESGAATSKTKSAAAKKRAAAKAAPDTTAAARAPVPGAAEMSALAFLSGKWKGELKSYPVQLDISIDGKVDAPARALKFAIHAEPATPLRLGIEGDYNSTLSYSERHKAVRALLTDTSGRGVEMLGEKVEGSRDWVFNSTEDGAPFPFKVRLTPVNPDQIQVNYTSGGRLALKYEVVFNRVES